MSSSTQEINVQVYDGYSISSTYLFDLATMPFKIRASSKCSFTFVFTGSPAGTLKLQATDECDDPSVRYMAPGVAGSGGIAWNDVPTLSQAVSSPGTVTLQAVDLPSRWIRAVYTASSGACTVSAWFSAKE